MSIFLPFEFTDRIKGQFPKNYPNFLAAINSQPTLSIRINKNKIEAHNTALEPVSWCKTGYYLEERPNFTIDPWFQSGAYYVQEPSSMFIWHILSSLYSEHFPEKVLDLCASPGGKTTLLASFFPDNTFIVANEVVQSRASVLAGNIDKWGSDNVVVTNSDPKNFKRIPNFFDLCLVDAPCSGEGLFRKDQSAINEWTPDNAHLCSQRQKRILMDTWDTLKPNGILIYSTCTFNPEENEENLHWLSTQQNFESIAISTKPEWGIETVEKSGISGNRFAYHMVKGVGYFVPVLRKTDAECHETSIPKKAQVGTSLPKGVAKKVASLTKGGNQFMLNDSIFSTTVEINYLSPLLGVLNIIRPGCKVASLIRDIVKPMHFLALSENLNRSEFQEIELNNHQINLFLRRENFQINDYPKGFYLATWNNLPVGFINHLGNRVNTTLPQELRIIKPFPFQGESILQKGFRIKP